MCMACSKVFRSQNHTSHSEETSHGASSARVVSLGCSEKKREHEMETEFIGVINITSNITNQHGSHSGLS